MAFKFTPYVPNWVEIIGAHPFTVYESEAEFFRNYPDTVRFESRGKLTDQKYVKDGDILIGYWDEMEE